MTLILPIFGERKKGILHILKKVDLSTFKEILKNVYIIAQSCFLTYFYFAWKVLLDLKSILLFAFVFGKNI